MVWGDTGIRKFILGQWGGGIIVSHYVLGTSLAIDSRAFLGEMDVAHSDMSLKGSLPYI